MIAQQEFKPSSTRSVKISRFLFSNSTETFSCGISCYLNQPNNNNHKIRIKMMMVEIIIIIIITTTTTTTKEVLLQKCFQSQTTGKPCEKGVVKLLDTLSGFPDIVA